MSRLKRSDSMAVSHNESGSEFQTVGLATEKARVESNVWRRNHGIFSLQWLVEHRDVGKKKLCRLPQSCHWQQGNLGARYQKHRQQACL